MLHRRKKKLFFKSERDLEDFVWVHLHELFSLRGLKRQYAIKQDICDILAVDEAKQLTILELKNTTDRYIVQQLTRYYDRLITEKPFVSEINYDLPVRLIAIAPTYHEHNLIDQKYSFLNIEFLTYEVLELEDQSIRFMLNGLDQSRHTEILIPSSQDHEENQSERSEEEIKQDKVDKILHHYVKVRCAHKLGLPDVSPAELAASSAKFTAKGSKVYKIQLDEYTPSGSPRFVSVRVPSTIGVIKFWRWVAENVPAAIGVKAEGSTLPIYHTRGEQLNQVDESKLDQVDIEVVDCLVDKDLDILDSVK
ncbi:MAG: DUF91 domain-containing protein [Lyngbya sp. HA4199-MV5]|jgi:hypothetical protein|nr:DUF91 domain-containing protein [Lyngbya sp. HA4199-MV5]